MKCKSTNIYENRKNIEELCHQGSWNIMQYESNAEAPEQLPVNPRWKLRNNYQSILGEKTSNMRPCIIDILSNSFSK